ncbi:MAG: MBL fold metallo-hydrolase [Promethearchaeota archaeon]
MKKHDGPEGFEPKLVKEDDIYGTKKGFTLRQLKPNLYMFDSQMLGSHVYLILGEQMNMLIDTGVVSKFNSFNYLLTTEIGIKIEDINLIVNTHAHFDHISNNCFFKCPIAAHRNAAAKIKHSDELITKAKKWSVDMSDFHIDIWLEERNKFDLGNEQLEVIETPGHTSGSICLYEPVKRYLFTGDTLFSGALPNVYESGSISEMIYSISNLDCLKVYNFLPGHGPPVFGEENVKRELQLSLKKANENLENFIERVKSNPIEKARPPPSLYNREGQDL